MSYRHPVQLDFIGRHREHSALSAVLCGDYVETTLHPTFAVAGQDRAPQQVRKSALTADERARLSQMSANNRATRMIRQLTNANRLYVLHTLTYAVSQPTLFDDEAPWTIRPVDWTRIRDNVIADWTRFARAYRDHCKALDTPFCYIALIERHTGKRASDTSIKIGTYHVHFVSNRVHDKRTLQRYWTHGLCNYSDWRVGRKSRDLQDGYDLPPCDNPGAYISKYIAKDADNSDRALNRKRYWTGGLTSKPIRLSDSEAARYCAGAKLIWERLITIDVPGYTADIIKQTYYIGGHHERQ
jgi:hypothetical protein